MWVKERQGRMKSGAIGAREERTSAYIKRQGAAVFIVRVSVGRAVYQTRSKYQWAKPRPQGVVAKRGHPGRTGSWAERLEVREIASELKCAGA